MEYYNDISNINNIKKSIKAHHVKDGFFLLSEASKKCSYSQEYLSLLARRGELKAKKINSRWYTSELWLNEYVILHPVTRKGNTKGSITDDKSSASFENNFLNLSFRDLVASFVSKVTSLIRRYLNIKSNIYNSKVSDGDHLISLKDAASCCSYSQEYLSLLARRGDLSASKVNGVWFTKESWLRDYVKSHASERKGNSKGKLFESVSKGGKMRIVFVLASFLNLLRNHSKGFGIQFLKVVRKIDFVKSFNFTVSYFLNIFKSRDISKTLDLNQNLVIDKYLRGYTRSRRMNSFFSFKKFGFSSGKTERKVHYPFRDFFGITYDFGFSEFRIKLFEIVFLF
jgi:hypothetical protein